MKDVTKCIPQGLGLSLTNNTNLYGGKVILEKNVYIFKYQSIVFCLPLNFFKLIIY